VTRVTAVAGPGCARHVLRVIELHVEAFIESIGKRLTRWVVPINTGVADRAHGNGRRGELSQMTAGAGLMAGKTRPRGIVRALVTSRACK